MTTPIYGIQGTDDLRDILEKYLPYYIPTVTSVDPNGDGRKLMNLLGGSIRNLHAYLDFLFRNANPEDVEKLEHALKVFSVINYQSPGPSAASCDVVFSLKGGPKGVDYTIPQYTILRSVGSPSVYGVTATTATVLAGETSVSGTSVIEGSRSTGETVAFATGGPDQVYKVSSRYIPKEHLTIYVNAVAITRVDSLFDYGDTDLVVEAVYDHEGYLYLKFGDGIHGAEPQIGDAITIDRILCSGEAGNFTTGEAQFQVIVGAAAAEVNVSQSTACTGGSVGPDLATVKATAPGVWQSTGYVRREEDAQALANDYPGVYSSLATRPGGSLINVYVMPDGGGVASVVLLAALDSYLNGKAIAGIEVDTYSLVPVPLVTTLRVVLKKARYRLARTSIATLIRDALKAVLAYTEVEIGRGMKMSDLADLVENVGDGVYVDYVDTLRLTREPRVVKNNVAAPDMVAFSYDSTLQTGTWKLMMQNTTHFFVAVNGVIQETLGEIGVEYSYGGLSFTLGNTGDLLTVGDEYTLYVSAYLGNLSLQNDEYNYYRSDGDIEIDILYSEEDA